MRIIYSTQAIVQYDGVNYFSNAVQSTYKRYSIFGGEIRVLCYIKKVEKGTEDLIDKGAVSFVEMQKQNTLKSLFSAKKHNAAIVEEEVQKADICFAHIPCEHGEMVVRYSKKYNKPYMTVVVGCPWDSYWNYNWKGKFMAPGAYLSLRKTQKDAPYSIYVTNNFLQSRYPTTGQWIGCSNVNISTGVAGVLEKRIALLNARKEDHAVLKIGTAAALDVPYKGQSFVIRALALLKARGVKFEYHLVGGGKGTALKELTNELGLQDQVFIHGRIEHSKITEFLDDMDIYIQPSKQEGLPRATIEAMSRGCLCLGSKIAGIPELLDSTYLFPKGDVKEIARILENITYDECISQAKRNYEEAKAYDCDLLNKRRQEFILRFMNSFTCK